MMLEKGEEIRAEVRKHWFLFVLQIVSMVLLAILPLIGGALFVIFTDQISAFDVTGAHIALFIFAYSIFLLILWIITFIHWTDHYLDEWIVTPQRVIDIEQRGLFHREVTSMRLDRVQDITVEVPGLLATILDFGEIRIQSAGDVREMIIEGVRRPVEAKKLIASQVRAVREKPQEVTMAASSLSDGEDI